MKTELKNKRIFHAFLGILIGSFVVSLASFFLHSNKVRRLCLFMSYDSDRLCSEVRYFPRMDRNEAVTAFVEDLLLGPFTNRYKSIYSKGTKLEFCFSKGKTLYLGLSAEALKTDEEVTDIRRSAELVRKNIVKNFTSFNKICIFIDGAEVSGEEF